MRNSGWILWIVFILLVLVSGAFSEDRKREESRVYRFISERNMTGTVDKISAKRISLRTDGGAAQVFRIDPSLKSDFSAKKIEPGDRVALSFDRSSYRVIGIHKTDGAGSIKNLMFISNPPASQIKFIQPRTE